ncbi:Uncharacterised protein [Klebsiella pneumoniae]|nr:Uncharacterised protein [Klebsiella pneumoniae]
MKPAFGIITAQTVITMTVQIEKQNAALKMIRALIKLFPQRIVL